MFKTGKSHPYAKYPRVEKEIIRLVVKNPELGSRQIAKRLSEKLSHVQVNSLLKKLGAETYDRRINFGRNYAGPGRLKNDVAHEVVNKCLAGFNVSKLSNEYLVSRDTIYRWLKKYNAGAKLNSNYVVGVNHPKAVYPKFEQQVLDLVSKNPNLTPSKIAKNLPISSYTIWKIFDQNNLNSIAQRNLFAVNHQEIPEQIKSPDFTFSEIKSNNFFQTPNTLPGPPPKENVFFNFWKTLVFTSLTTLPLGLGFLNYQQNYITGIGTLFATIALFFGGVFFLYSLKYYLTLLFVLSYSPKDKKLTPRNSIENFFFKFTKSSYNSTGIVPDLGGVILEKKPFVSVHVSLFNEKNVVERIVKAVTSFEYPEYEVILADDSTDETVNIIKAFQEKCLFKGEQLKVETYDGYTLTQVEVRPNVYLKHIHRQKRDGFKGAALAIALNHVNPKTEYISIFDADFVPYPDSLNLFLKYFQESRDEKVAVVQGYQWHVLNKSENWITRGVRSEYSGSYVVERSGAEIYGGLKQIAGSVYMIKKDVLSSIGWGRSITEDFELTLRLYEKGYKVLYTPYVQAPAECVSTLTRLIRQRMRWAEGHSFNIKKMFSRLVTSPSLTVPEKVELVYLAPYYLQAFFFLIGTFAWLLAETVFRVRLPFWTEVWGWSLIFTNMVALPLVNGVGLFLEESEHKDYSGLGSFIMLSYIVVPFQAYAAVKGFIEKEEGPWFRTPKTGRITDIFAKSTFYRFVTGFIPAKANSIEDTFELPKNYKDVVLADVQDEFDLTNEHISHRPINKRLLSRSIMAFAILITFVANQLLLLQYNFPQAGTSSNGITLTSKKAQYSLTEKPEFTLSLGVSQVRPRLSGISTVYAQEENVVDIKAGVSYRGTETDIPVSVNKEDGLYGITVDTPNALKPGKYTLSATITKDGQQQVVKQDFTWGVLAMNSAKSIYAPNERIKFGFGVVDDAGRTICDAKLKLMITVPSEKKSYELSTQNGKIKQSGECSRESVTNKADYLAEFDAKDIEENYQLHLEALSYNGKKTIDDHVVIKKDTPFDVERSEYPTRIYPKASYDVRIKVKANRDFHGLIVDKFPHKEFYVENVSNMGKYNNNDQEISWDVQMQKDEVKDLTYKLSFPLLSPEFYQIGPLKFIENKEVVFTEARSWQVAADAIAFVQGPTAASCLSTTTCSKAFSSSNTAGNLIVVAVRTNGTSVSVTSVTDTRSNNYQLAIGPVRNGSTGYIYYAENIASGANTVTVDIDSAVNYRVAINEYSGLATSNALDKTNSASNTSTTTHDSGTTDTTTQANELLFANFAVSGSTNTLTGDTGQSYNVRQTSSSFMLTEDKIVSATGAYNATMSTNVNVTSAGMIATFSDTSIPENWQIFLLLSPVLVWGLSVIRKRSAK